MLFNFFSRDQINTLGGTHYPNTFQVLGPPKDQFRYEKIARQYIWHRLTYLLVHFLFSIGMPGSKKASGAL
jgi:hypothetical protein